MDNFRSSAFHFRDFIETTIWSDMLQELKTLRTNVLESLAVEEDEKEIFRGQGRAQVLMDLQQLPYGIMAMLEEDREVDEDVEVNENFDDLERR